MAYIEDRLSKWCDGFIEIKEYPELTIYCSRCNITNKVGYTLCCNRSKDALDYISKHITKDNS